MKRIAIALIGLLVSCAALADSRPLLVVSEVIAIKAAPEKVWNFVKPFDSLPQWHPAFATAEIVSGTNSKVGSVRALTIKDGPTFTEELLAVNEQAMAFTYSILEGPLPVDRYVSTMSVKPDGQGGSIVTWVGVFSRKNPRDKVAEGENDAAALGLITGAYQGGLQNLKKLME
jgi:mxaD protein